MSLEPKKRHQEFSEAEKEAVISAFSQEFDSESEPSPAAPVSSLRNVVRSSKFRHIEGKYRHQSSYITKLPSLSSTVPGDSNGFQVDRASIHFLIIVGDAD